MVNKYFVYFIDMPARWNAAEEKTNRLELEKLYIRDNKSIKEIALLLNLGESTVYDRLIRLGIPSLRAKKEKYNNQRIDIVIPSYSPKLAEFIGLMLGDGHITPSQVTVTIGKKDLYAPYVCSLITYLFKVFPKTIFSEKGDCIVYFGSTRAVRWLLEMGLASNKVKKQVDIPKWISKKPEFMRKAIRELFDTDGSVYRVRFGIQVSFCNHSSPLLRSVRRILLTLGFHPSKISGYNLYLTRREDTDRFFREIGFKNLKHRNRFLEFRKE